MTRAFVAASAIAVSSLLCGIESIAADIRFGADLFVSPKGNDGNPGSLERPLAALQRAIDVAAPGQVICLRGGTYRPSRSIVFRKAGAEDAVFEVRGYPGELPLIDGSGLPAEPTLVFRRARRRTSDAGRLSAAGVNTIEHVAHAVPVGCES